MTSEIRSPKASTRKPYSSPVLQKVGSLRDTRAGGDGQADSGGLETDFSDFTIE